MLVEVAGGVGRTPSLTSLADSPRFYYLALESACLFESRHSQTRRHDFTSPSDSRPSFADLF